MKKTKVLMATNLYQVDPIVYAGHLDMFYKLGKHADEIEIVFLAPWRTPIDKARNDAAQLAMMLDCDYLFFYDDDMYFKDGNFVIEMINTIKNSEGRINIMQALAFIRGFPFKPMIFKLYDVGKDVKKMKAFEDYDEHIEEDGLVKCDAVGCCATIIDVNLFKEIPMPYFLTGQDHTEDIYFCAKCASYLENVGIYCNTKIEIGHLLDKIILTKENKMLLKDFHLTNNVNQLFLPDPTFIPMMKVHKSAAFDFDDRINPLEHIDELTGGTKDESGH